MIPQNHRVVKSTRRKKRQPAHKNKRNYWWLRSPYVSLTTHFYHVSAEGTYNSNGAYTSYGVCFGFCISYQETYLHRSAKRSELLFSRSSQILYYSYGNLIIATEFKICYNTIKDARTLNSIPIENQAFCLYPSHTVSSPKRSRMARVVYMERRYVLWLRSK